MNADLEVYEQDQAAVVAHPLTGEAIDLRNAPDEELAKFLEGLDSDRNAIQDAKRIVSEEAIRRMDAIAEWTLRAGPYRLSTRSPEPSTTYGDHRKVEWDDGHDLLTSLLELVEEGLLNRRLAESAVETVAFYKIKVGNVKKLRKLGGRVAEVIDRHAREVHKPRYVRWERS